MHRRLYSAFALVDVSDFKKALKAGHVTREKLISLRDGIDAVAAKYSNVLFISYADSLLLKSNWSVKFLGADVGPSYEPEQFIRVVANINNVYLEKLGLSTYAILTQGDNEYYDDTLAHVSSSRNHISLNSLGLPFAQLQTIDLQAKKEARNSGRAELYLERSFLNSLRMRLEFDKKALRKRTYQDPLSSREESFYCAERDEILKNLLSDW